MTHIQMTQKTFGKKTQKLIKQLLPSAVTSKKITTHGVSDYVIRDSNKKMVASWLNGGLLQMPVLVINNGDDNGIYTELN